MVSARRGTSARLISACGGKPSAAAPQAGPPVTRPRRRPRARGQVQRGPVKEMGVEITAEQIGGRAECDRLVGTRRANGSPNHRPHPRSAAPRRMIAVSTRPALTLVVTAVPIPYMERAIIRAHHWPAAAWWARAKRTAATAATANVWPAIRVWAFSASTCRARLWRSGCSGRVPAPAEVRPARHSVPPHLCERAAEHGRHLRRLGIVNAASAAVRFSVWQGSVCKPACGRVQRALGVWTCPALPASDVQAVVLLVSAASGLLVSALAARTTQPAAGGSASPRGGLARHLFVRVLCRSTRPPSLIMRRPRHISRGRSSSLVLCLSLAQSITPCSRPCGSGGCIPRRDRAIRYSNPSRRT